MQPTAGFGFKKSIIRQVKIHPGVELSLRDIQLEIASHAELVEVTAEMLGVQTTNAEIAATLTNAQVTRLPSLNRSPLAFIAGQAGVGNGRANTTINGLRPSSPTSPLRAVSLVDTA